MKSTASVPRRRWKVFVAQASRLCPLLKDTGETPVLRISSRTPRLPVSETGGSIRDADPTGIADDEPMRIDRLRRRIADAVGPLVRLLRPGLPVKLSTIASTIFTVFDALGVRQTIVRWMSEPAGSDRAGSKLEEAEEHQQVWTKLIDLFEQMVDLLGPIEVTATDFVDIVESGLEGFDLAITPPAPDQVLVGQVDRALPGGQGGVRDGIERGENSPRRRMKRRCFPIANGGNCRDGAWSFDPDCNRRLLDERLLGYIAFTQASETLIVSRAASDDANRLNDAERLSESHRRIISPRPSARDCAKPNRACQSDRHAKAVYFRLDALGGNRQAAERSVSEVDRAAGALVGGAGASRSTQTAGEGAGGTQENDDWPALYHWFVTKGVENPAIERLQELAWPALSYANQASLSPAARNLLFASPLSLNVSQLETMAACSFKHFARYGLRLATARRGSRRRRSRDGLSSRAGKALFPSHPLDRCGRGNFRPSRPSKSTPRRNKSPEPCAAN